MSENLFTVMLYLPRSITLPTKLRYVRPIPLFHNPFYYSKDCYDQFNFKFCLMNLLRVCFDLSSANKGITNYKISFL